MKTPSEGPCRETNRTSATCQAHPRLLSNHIRNVPLLNSLTAPVNSEGVQGWTVRTLAARQTRRGWMVPLLVARRVAAPPAIRPEPMARLPW